MQKRKTDANDTSNTNIDWAKTNYGFRWIYLLFPFIPTWLIAKSLAQLFWHITCSFFENDDSDLASVYTEDRSNRVAFLIMLLFLAGCMAYMLCL